MKGWVTGHRSICQRNDSQRTLHYCSTLLLRQYRPAPMSETISGGCISDGGAFFWFRFLATCPDSSGAKKENESAPQALGSSSQSIPPVCDWNSKIQMRFHSPADDGWAVSPFIFFSLFFS
jgi:hypothetical protein